MTNTPDEILREIFGMVKGTLDAESERRFRRAITQVDYLMSSARKVTQFDATGHADTLSDAIRNAEKVVKWTPRNV